MSDSEKMMSLVDSTHRIKWEVTEEEFNNCNFPDRITSPTYAMDINGEKIEWYLLLYPKGMEEKDKNQVFTALVKKHDDKVKKHDDKVYKLKFEFGIETQDGYWPEDALSQEHSFGNSKDKTDGEYKGWGYCLCTPEEFKKYFVGNKVTIMAFFVIYLEGDKHLNDMKVADDFVEKIRSMSSFDNLSDFSLTSGDESFPCHRVLLAARSKYFEALFRNEPSKKETEMDETPHVVMAMLDFMYKGVVPKDIDEKAFDLILMSDKYGLDLLTMACETSLVKNVSPDNAVETLITIDKIKHVSKQEHRKKVLTFIKNEVDVVSKTQDWNKFVQTYPNLITEIMCLK